MKPWAVVFLVLSFLAVVAAVPITWFGAAVVSAVAFERQWEKGEERGVAYFNGQRVEGRERYDQLQREWAEDSLSTCFAAAGLVGFVGIAAWLIALVVTVARSSREPRLAPPMR